MDQLVGCQASCQASSGWVPDLEQFRTAGTILPQLLRLHINRAAGRTARPLPRFGLWRIRKSAALLAAALECTVCRCQPGRISPHERGADATVHKIPDAPEHCAVEAPELMIVAAGACPGAAVVPCPLPRHVYSPDVHRIAGQRPCAADLEPSSLGHELSLHMFEFRIDQRGCADDFTTRRTSVSIRHTARRRRRGTVAGGDRDQRFSLGHGTKNSKGPAHVP